MNGSNLKFHARRNTGTKEQPRWEYMGTVVIRANLKGGVLYLKTDKVDAEGKPVSIEIALFPPRPKGDAPAARAAA